MILYPPRPKNIILRDNLPTLERGGLFTAQPKLNGSNAVVQFRAGQKPIVRNRHNEPMKAEIAAVNMPIVVNGEWMNKGPYPPLMFCIFDILEVDDEILTGITFEERQAYMDILFGTAQGQPSDDLELHDLLVPVTGNVLRIKNFETDFTLLYDSITPIPLVEGLVCKRKSAKLEPMIRPENNAGWQVKIRKPNNMYKA